MPRLRVITLLLCLCAASLGVACQNKSPQRAVEAASAFAERQPRYMRSLPHTKVPEGLTDLRAETCGACHQAIYNEWKISTHARAWLDDAQFLAELEKSEKQGVAWMCMNCHTPLQNQLPKLVTGLKDGRVDQAIMVDNPAFDSALQKEAITCATCHVKDGVVLGPFGDTNSPHPVKKEPSLRTVEVCTQCHQAQARFDAVGLICVFNTGQEHQDSPQAAAGKICQDCHMPTVERPLWVGGTEPRTVRRHWFGGSLIPKKPEYAEELAAIAQHFPPGLSVKTQPLPKAVKPGQTVQVDLRIKNAEAGHYLPSGDPERFLRIQTRVVDAQGKALAEHIETIGIEYQWHPVVKKLSDNRLAPLEERMLSLSFKAPASGPLTVHVQASRWRINERNLAYHELEGKYVPGQSFFKDVHQIDVKK